MVDGGFSSNPAWRDGMVAGNMFKALLDRGQTLFLVCHGSQPKFVVAEIVPDIHRAVRFIRTHAGEYGVDGNRLGIRGASLGGYLSLAIGTGGKDGDAKAADPVDRASS